MTFYQPFYNLRSDQLQGLEALARRRVDGNGRAELPAGFFADAVRSGRMRDLDLHILDDAVSHLARWYRSDAWHELILSVNLSWDFIGHANVVNDVTGALRRHGVPGDRLLVDITMDTFRRLTTTEGEALERLLHLQDREVTFCLDSFTAGDLDVLPDAAAVQVDIIKLHPRQLALDAPGAAEELSGIARAIQDLGLPVVAAGVETPEQLALVRDLDFEWAQGFLLGEPVPADQALSTSPTLSPR